MNTLMKINHSNDRITVSARELYTYLEATERFQSWFDRLLKYGFVEGTDYLGCKVFNTLAKQELQDYEITVEMGKQLAMLQRNEKGKKARQYFIQIEKKWNSPEAVINRALEISRQQINNLMLENEELKPKALFADTVSASINSITVGDLATLISQSGHRIGQNTLYRWLREYGYVIKSGRRYNHPTQKSRKLGVLELDESTITNKQGTRTVYVTKVTGKGQTYFVEKFNQKRKEEE